MPYYHIFTKIYGVYNTLIIIVFKVSNTTGALREKDWQKWCKGKKLNEPLKAHRYFFPTTTQAIQATISGVGLFVTHSTFVGDNIVLGLLQTVDSVPVKTNQHYYMVMLKEKMHEPNIEAFTNYIQSVSF